MTNMTSSHSLPLNDEHEALAAKMVDFAGWRMPLQYESVLTEYDYNRKQCSIFDCSHMGEFIIRGHYRDSGLDQIVTQKLSDMPILTCRYGAMLNDQGGVIDDLIVYRIKEEEWMLVVNASNTEKNSAHIQSNLNNGEFQDVSSQTVKLDVQGPLSRAILSEYLPAIDRLKYYGFDVFRWEGEEILVSRTGYTGELGFEIYAGIEISKKIWKQLLKSAKLSPTGLAVRDVLRIEMCYCLYGHELSETISPLKAGLLSFIDMEKEFIGKDKLLLEQGRGVDERLVCIASNSRRSPREGHVIENTSHQVIGRVTSGTFSPALGVGIGIGYVAKSSVKTDDQIYFGDEKRVSDGYAISRPFYKNGSLKS